MKRIIYFPAAFALNTFSLQLLVVVAGLSGSLVVAADLSLAQASMLAVFFALSGNARNLIIKAGGDSDLGRDIARFRLVLAPLLSVVALCLSVFVSQAGVHLSVIILVRQLSEWFSELKLSQLEKECDVGAARLFILANALPLILAVASLLFFPPAFNGFLILWAALPLLLCFGFIRETASVRGKLRIDWRKILPNCASTTVIGTGVFLFRVLVSGFAGKTAAGELFTAFAFGGVLSSVYERSIGPTLNLVVPARAVRAWGNRLLFLFPSAGLLLVGLWYFYPHAFSASSHDGYLFPAMGLSLVGGSVMLKAQALKIRLLHSTVHNDLFIPDLLSNFLILFSIPALFLVYGPGAFVYSFLLNSLFVYLCYWGVLKTEGVSAHTGLARIVQWVVAFAIIAPVFLQLKGAIFRSPEHVYDWGGNLALLPLPVSLFVCFPAIVFFQAFKSNKWLPAYIFAMSGLMLSGAVLIGGSGLRDKIILALQYLLPYWGLVLGEFSDVLLDFPVKLAKAFLLVVSFVIPFQLAVSIFGGSPRILPDLYLFSVYNNLQYAPVVLISGFIFSLFAIYEERRKWFAFLLPALFLYSGMSWSISASFLLFSGTALFLLLRKPGRVFILAAGVGLVLFVSYGAFLKHTGFTYKFKFLAGSSSMPAATAVPQQEPAPRHVILTLLPNLEERLDIWKYFSDRLISTDVRHFLVGSESVPDRSKIPSAHNYYLDMLYNWGFLSLSLFISLVWYTAVKVWRNRAAVVASHGLLGLSLVVMFLVLLDNLIKVGLRQPYPGIFTFFLWGLLISQLKRIESENACVLNK